MPKTSTPTSAQFAAAELTFRTPAKAERNPQARYVGAMKVPVEIIALSGAELRALAGTLSPAAPTAAELAQARNAVRKAERTLPAPARKTNLEAAVEKRQNTSDVRQQVSSDRAAAEAIVRLGRSTGNRVPRWVLAVSKGRTCPVPAPKA